MLSWYSFLAIHGMCLQESTSQSFGLLRFRPTNLSCPGCSVSATTDTLQHGKNLRESSTTVAIEASGYAEDVHTVMELESKLKGCHLKGPCAWQFSFTPTDVSVIAPEPHVIYHYSLHTIFEHDKTVYRIRGQFPKVRYFSVQTYTFLRQPIDGRADYQIKPSSGVNPFTTPVHSADENGYYEIYFTANGDQGYPNELRAYHPDRMLTRLQGGRNTSYNLFTMAIRFYASDPRNDQSLTWGKGASLFGFVDPPIVEWKKHDQEAFQVIPQCTAAEEQCNTAILDKFMSFPQFLLPLRDIPGFICPVAETEKINSDFYLWRAKLPAILDLYIGFKNSDVTYFYWCDIAARMGKNFVLKITGTLGTTPMGLYDEPLVSKPEEYDARYISFHAVDLRPPMPSYSAIYDGDLWAQHGKGWNRQYSIVSAEFEYVAEACGLLDHSKDTFLAFNRADGNMSSRHVATPGIIYREILPRVSRLGEGGKSPTDVALQCNMEQGTPDTVNNRDVPSGSNDHAPKRSHNPLCDDPNFSRLVMQERYPEIVVYHCDVNTGVATVLA